MLEILAMFHHCCDIRDSMTNVKSVKIDVHTHHFAILSHVLYAVTHSRFLSHNIVRSSQSSVDCNMQRRFFTCYQAAFLCQIS